MCQAYWVNHPLHIVIPAPPPLFMLLLTSVFWVNVSFLRCCKSKTVSRGGVENKAVTDVVEPADRTAMEKKKERCSAVALCAAIRH